MLISLTRRHPWTFYRYIIAETLKPFAGAALFFLFVLLMFQIIRLADVLVVHNVSPGQALTLLGYLGLTFMPVIFPIAFLLAVLLGFGRLSTDGEVLAMRAAGMSVYRMVVPVFALGSLLTLITLFCNLYFVPYGAKQFRYQLLRIYNSKAVATIHEGTFTTEGFFDLVLYAQTVNSTKNTLEKVMIYDERNPDAPITVVAHRGELLSNLQNAAGTPGLVLRLLEGSLHRGNPKERLYEKTDFDAYDIFLPIEISKVGGITSAKTADSSFLRARVLEIREKLKAGAKWEQLTEWERMDYLTMDVEYWKRYALSAACAIFALMGVAFGVVRTRTVRSNSFILCLLVLLFYWGLYSLGFNLANEGKVPAVVGMWAADIVLLLIALFTLRRVAH